MGEFFLNEIDVDGTKILLQSIRETWGEDDTAVADLVAGTYDEPATLAFWMAICRRAGPADMLVDVGGFSGLFTLLALKSSKLGKVVTFEPSSSAYGRLIQNIRLNGILSRAIPCNLAASDSERLETLGHRWGIFSMCSGESFHSVSTDHTQHAYCIPLDYLTDASKDVHYLNSKAQKIWPFDKVRAIKIDVEGSEGAVLQGARELILAHQPVIIAEFLDQSAARMLQSFASSVGYLCNPIGAERNMALFAKRDVKAAKELAKAIARPARISGTRQLFFNT